MVPGVSSAQQAWDAVRNNVAQTATQRTENSTAALSGVTGGAAGAEASPSYATPFSGVLRDAISKTQELNTQAANTVTEMLEGKGVDLHTAMIATEKSELAFELMMALRNKAVGAYQQLMGMQF